jgi:hypothetical protein
VGRTMGISWATGGAAAAARRVHQYPRDGEGQQQQIARTSEDGCLQWRKFIQDPGSLDILT